MAWTFSGEVRPLFDKLLAADVARQLPGEPVETVPEPTDEELGRLLTVASRLALDDIPDAWAAAYEIATRTVEIRQSASPVFVSVAELILSRLGNFPGRELLRRRYHDGGRNRSALTACLLLEALAREVENTVETTEGRFTPLTDFQYDLLKMLQEGRNVSISAPTSAGKSFVLSLDIVRQLKAGQSSIIYLVPTRALIRQVMLDVSSVLRTAGLSRIPVRCVPIPLSRENAPNGVVYVLTQERLLSLLSHPNENVWVTSLVVDEAQGVKDGARGVLLQMAVDMVLKTFPKATVHFASPLTRNPEFLLFLFGCKATGQYIRVDYSPVSQNLILVSEVKNRPTRARFHLLTAQERVFLGEHELPFRLRGKVFVQRANLARAITGDEDSTILYANEPTDTEELAEALVADTQPPERLDEEIEEFIEFLRDHVHPEYQLIQVLQYGVAFHYGLMPGIVRSRIEELVQAEKIRFICCTSTLLQGVNLPAKHIVIENPSRGRGKPMDRADFLNLAGRAGRLLQEFHGNVWCIRPEQWEQPSYEGETLQAITSAFDGALEDGGTIVQETLAGNVERDLRDLGRAVLGRVFAEYTRSGRDLATSKYRTSQNEQTLQNTAASLQAVSVTLPSEVFVRNPTVLPTRLQALYDALHQEQAIQQWLPLSPYEQGVNERLKLIFRLLETTLADVHNDSHVFHAWLGAQWIHGVSLAEIIRLRVNYLKGTNRFTSVRNTIFQVLKSLEEDLRFRYVKHVRAFLDILAVVLLERGQVDEAQNLPPLHLFLECGASDTSVLSLMSLGLSRTTSLLLRKSEILSIVVYGRFSGGDFGGFLSVDERNSSDHVGDELGAVEQPPSLGSRLHQLVDHRQAGGPRSAPLGLLRAEPHGGKGGLDRVGRPQVNPVLGGEVVEGQEHLPILRQALDCLGVFRLVGLHEQVERLVGVLLRVGHPDGVQLRLGFRLKPLGQLVQHVGRLMDAAALLPRVGPHLPHRLPEAQGPVADHQLRIDGKPSGLHLQQQAQPGLLALPVAVGQGDQFFFSVGGGSHHHQDALPVLFQADVEMHPVHPDIHVLLALQGSLAPLLVLLLPDGLQPRDCGRREPRSVRTQQGRQGLAEVSGAHALQVQPGDQLLDALALSQVRRQDL